MIQFEFRLVSGLTKVLPDQAPASWEHPALWLLRKERGFFQLACYCRGDDFGASDSHFTVSVSPALPCYRVRLVPCAYPCHGTYDDNYLTTRPGLLPDLLQPYDLQTPLKAVSGQWRALWFSVEDLPAGLHQIRLTVTLADGTEAAAFTLPVTVYDEVLPPQTLYHTEWFHGDCLADYYQVPVWSDRHWELIDHFMEAAARCGVNMLLTPVFTPPLDTAQGGERTTIQLVDVTLSLARYRFHFDKLRKWVQLCRKHGITEIEISHLFSQWGAIYPPKIMVREHGALVRRFGWHTPAVGGAYTRFLEQFLPALKKELQSLGVWEHTWFHISDEPGEADKESYLAAKNSVLPLLKGCKIMDALSSYTLYEEGVVERPVVGLDHLEPFLQAKVPELWGYYCTAQAIDVPNRFMAMPSTRNRILGILLYVYNLQGFLHWGFNFYNSQYSLAHIDPFRITDAGDAFPSGDAFLVYPAPDGTAWPSIRSEVLARAMEDVRLLQLAERRLGREQVVSLITETAGYLPTFTRYPRGEAYFDRLRTAVFAALGLEERRNLP